MNSEGKLKEYQKYYRLFEEELINDGLSKNVIQRHLGNVEFYFEYYCLEYNDVGIDEAYLYVNNFFPSWYIRKSCSVSKTDLMSICSSIKKFNKFLVLNNVVSKGNNISLHECIKTNTSSWIEEVEEFNYKLMNYSDDDWDNEFDGLYLL